MTKRIGPEQKAHLRKIGSTRTKLDRVRQTEDAILRDLHNQVREGFILDISGIKLAEAAKLSLPRVYQVREEKDKG